MKVDKGGGSTAGPRIASFPSESFVMTLMRCQRNLTLVYIYIDQPVVKLVSLYILSFKVTEPVVDVKVRFPVRALDYLLKGNIESGERVTLADIASETHSHPSLV